MAAAADRNHVNTSCGDTVKCRLDAGKSPIFRSQSPCTDISVRKSQRVTIFVRIYPYKSLKGLRALQRKQQSGITLYRCKWAGGGGSRFHLEKIL